MTALPIPLLPLIRDDFALDYTQAGLVILAFSLPYGISQLPAGWLADHIGPRILLTIGIGGVALAGLLVGLSQTYVMTIAFLVLMGVAGGGYHPSAAPLVSSSVKPRNQGRALGFHQIGGSGSFFLAPLIAAAIASHWGWRASFITLAIPTALFAIMLYVFLGRRPVTSRAPKATPESHDKTRSPSSYLPRLAAFIVLSTFTKAVLFSTIAFIPLFMVDHFGIAEATAAASLSILYSAGLWAGLLGGHMSDRLGKIQVVLAACLVSGPLIYLLNLVSYGPGIGALLLVIGMVMYIRMPASESYIISQTPQHRRSTALGIYYFSGMEGGAILAPVMGSFIDRFGFYSSFTVATIAIVVVTLTCAVFLWRMRD